MSVHTSQVFRTTCNENDCFASPIFNGNPLNSYLFYHASGPGTLIYVYTGTWCTHTCARLYTEVSLRCCSCFVYAPCMCVCVNVDTQQQSKHTDRCFVFLYFACCGCLSRVFVFCSFCMVTCVQCLETQRYRQLVSMACQGVLEVLHWSRCALVVCVWCWYWKLGNMYPKKFMNHCRRRIIALLAAICTKCLSFVTFVHRKQRADVLVPKQSLSLYIYTVYIFVYTVYRFSLSFYIYM